MPSQIVKHHKALYTQESLNDALTAVRDGATLTAAAKQFGIPRSTLSGRWAALQPKILEKGVLATLNVKPALKSVHFGSDLQHALVKFNQGLKDNYYYIIEQLQDSSLKSSQLLCWYEESVAVAHMLDQHHGRMVDALLRVRWMEREAKVIAHFHKFVLSLVTANPVHLRRVIKNIISCFTPEASTAKDFGSDSLSATHATVHSILNDIFSLIPQSVAVAEDVFAGAFPYMRKPTETLVAYAKNLLLTATHQPLLRRPLIEVIIRNMVDIDVHSLRNEIEEAESEAGDDDGRMFAMEEDMVEDPLAMKHELADRLDLLMEVMLQYIRDMSYPQGELHPYSHQLFRSLLASFDEVILKVHQLSHVQFIYFYMCSFKQCFHEVFIATCWRKVTDVNSPPTLRQAASCYIASFVARAKYLPITTVKDCLDTMVEWARRYLGEATQLLAPGSHLCDVARHGTFYSVCQAIFYVIIFRHQQLIDSKLGYKYLESLHLQHLVATPLNPLKACLSSVVSLFAAAMRRHQLVYCDPIVERNNRQMLPVVGATMTSENPLESFFPFDPYLLKRSSCFISELYATWRGKFPEENDHQAETSDDDFLTAMDGKEHPASMEGSYKLLDTVSPGFASPV